MLKYSFSVTSTMIEGGGEIKPFISFPSSISRYIRQIGSRKGRSQSCSLDLQEKRKESVLQPHGGPVLDRMLKAGISKKFLKVKLQNSIVALKRMVP